MQSQNDVPLEDFSEDYGSNPVFSKNIKRSWVIIVITAIISLIVYNLLPFEENVKKGMILLLIAGIFWLTEALNIVITAIAIPVLAVLLKIGSVGSDGTVHLLTFKSVMANFANPIIYLFFGGFALATALHTQKLDRKIAMWIVSISGSKLGYATFALCSVTAVLSMWISNTATAVMMLPLAIGLINQIDKNDKKTPVFILLAIAYSASIGGIGTIVGSPPNAIAAANLGLGFDGWLKIGFPIMVVLFPLMFIVLYAVFRPNLNQKIEIRIEESIPWNLKRIFTLAVFIVTALSWIFSKKISMILGIKVDDALIALGAAVLVPILGLASWKNIANGTDWGVLLLFGGGIALSEILKVSGTSLVLGNEIAKIFGSYPHIVIILAVTIFIITMTEFTSNTASAALLVPVFATIATQVGLPKDTLVFVIGIGASCAFMLPVATPPNAIVFGTGYIKQKEMMKAGIALNVCCVIFLTLFIYTFLG